MLFQDQFQFPALSEPNIAPWILPGAERAFEGGCRALRAGFFEPARSIFTTLLSREPDHPEVGLALVRNELASGNPVDARRWFAELGFEGVMEPSLVALKTEILLGCGQATQAIALGMSCAEWFPSDPACRYLSGRFLWHGGDASRAEEVFLSLAGDPWVGPRACAWAVFCGWRQGHYDEVSELLLSLRDDDVVCEGLREFAHRSLGLDWVESDRVEPMARTAVASAWGGLYFRELSEAAGGPPVTGARLLG